MGRNLIRRKEIKIFDKLEEQMNDLEYNFRKEKFNLITYYINDYITIYKNSKRTTKDRQLFEELLLKFLEWMTEWYKYEKYYFCNDSGLCDECIVSYCCLINTDDVEGNFIPFSEKIFVDNFINLVEKYD